MSTLTAAKTRLHINSVQAAHLMQCIDVRRVAFNFALGRWQAMYEAWKADNILPKPSAFDIDKQFNAEKAAPYPWLYDAKGALVVPSCVGQEAIKHDIKHAFKHFFRRVKNGETPGYPKFKKRGRHESFTLTTAVFNNQHLHGNRLTPPKGWGVARLGDSIPEGKIKSVTISHRAGMGIYTTFYILDTMSCKGTLRPLLLERAGARRLKSSIYIPLIPTFSLWRRGIIHLCRYPCRAGKWWVSFLLETERAYPPCKTGAVGIDLGIAQFASLSNGIVYDGAKALEQQPITEKHRPFLPALYAATVKTPIPMQPKTS